MALQLSVLKKAPVGDTLVAKASEQLWGRGWRMKNCFVSLSLSRFEQSFLPTYHYLKGDFPLFYK